MSLNEFFLRSSYRRPESPTQEGSSGGFRLASPARGIGCLPDFNPDGTLDIFDILGFFDAFSCSDSRANFDDADPSLDVFDIIAFFEAFAAGCG